MSKSSTKLFTLNQFNTMHHDQQMSLYQIAEKYDTYPNKIRRLAQKLGANIRNKSEAQKVALATGRQDHPTQGKTRAEAVKVKISEGVASVWEDMPQKEKERRSQLAKDQWEQMPQSQKQDMKDKAAQGIRHAAKHGSKLEIELLDWLVTQGHQVTFHKQHVIANEKMHLDLLMRDMAIAIEIDGPSHSQPIWGQQTLSKSMAADAKKDGLLLGAGFSIIRVKQQKDLTKKLVRDIIYELEGVLKTISQAKKIRPKIYIIGE
jgi:very-short-patch-repair endonuclease